MYKYLLFLSVLLLFACQEKEVAPVQATISYPTDFVKVLDAHGGLDNWKDYRTLSYMMGEEKQTIDLNDRREMIEGENFTMGYDGQQFWVKADTSYKGNPIFYKNLIFYFYAMPFVLADPGIQFDKADDLSFDGKTYPGYRISYADTIGVSPEDEYFIHYDAETYQMAWLGYTVTYFTGEKSKKISWIKYDDWDEVGSVILPQSMEWYKTEDNLPTEPRNRREFSKISLKMNEAPEGTYAKIEGAEFVEE